MECEGARLGAMLCAPQEADESSKRQAGTRLLRPLVLGAFLSSFARSSFLLVSLFLKFARHGFQPYLSIPADFRSDTETKRSFLSVCEDSSLTTSPGKHPDVAFGDVALSKNQVRKIHGEDQGPGTFAKISAACFSLPGVAVILISDKRTSSGEPLIFFVVFKPLACNGLAVQRPLLD